MLLNHNVGLKFITDKKSIAFSFQRKNLHVLQHLFVSRQFMRNAFIKGNMRCSYLPNFQKKNNLGIEKNCLCYTDLAILEMKTKEVKTCCQFKVVHLCPSLRAPKQKN